MATPAEWLEGARLRTLPAAVAPVLAGTGAAAWGYREVWWKAGLALVVSLALQVGVNYANDYSDGVRGTDDDRVGPMRLVGSGAATPGHVKAAAFGCFALAGIAGLVLALTTAWWLLLVGAAAILAAWYYTGGSRPYGYSGLGEVMVFVFFGLVAVLGTTFVQVHGHRPLGPLPPSIWPPSPWTAAWFAAVGVGALACAILVANNLRDIPSDTESGKRTLAVILGPTRTKALYFFLVVASVIALVGIALATTWWVLVALVGVVPLVRAIALIHGGATGPALIPVLKLTGIGQLLYAFGIFVALLAVR